MNQNQSSSGETEKDMSSQNDNTPTGDELFRYIQSEEDVTTFIHILKDVLSNMEDVKTPYRSTLQLLWLMTAYVFHNCEGEDRSFASIEIILNKACTACEHIDHLTSFGIMIGECSQESLKENYESFRVHVFGTHSNFYKKILAECSDVLKAMPIEKIIEELENNNPEESTDTKKKYKPLFDKLIQNTGQELQIELYNKRLTALHESGHAVAAYLLGFEIAGMSIIETNTHDGHTYIDNSKPAESTQIAIIDFAGLAATDTNLQSAFSDLLGSASDIRSFTKHIKNEVIKKYSNPTDAQKYAYIDADVLGLADQESPYIVYETIKRCLEVREMTVKLIEENNDLVKALAQEILEKKIMPGEEIKAFLDKCREEKDK